MSKDSIAYKLEEIRLVNDHLQKRVTELQSDAEAARREAVEARTQMEATLKTFDEYRAGHVARSQKEMADHRERTQKALTLLGTARRLVDLGARPKVKTRRAVLRSLALLLDAACEDLAPPPAPWAKLASSIGVGLLGALPMLYAAFTKSPKL